MSGKFQKIVIIGATSSIADHCAHHWLKSAPLEMILVGRDSEKLSRLANDYRVRSPKTNISSLVLDFSSPEAIQEFAKTVCSKNDIDLVLIAHGVLPDQITAQNNPIYTAEQIHINGVSPVIFAESFVHELNPERSATIAIIGSVAGDRGRKSNYVYGAAKGLVTRYAQGLQHRLANTKLQISLIKPGPTLTPMTISLSSTKGFASVENVAKDIVKGIDLGKRVIYTPAKWQLIMLIIQHLPSFIFNKMNI